MTHKRNWLANGRFEHDLNDWTVGGGAVYSAGDGDAHYGVAVLGSQDDHIEQTFTVPWLRSYMLHYAFKVPSGWTGTGDLGVTIMDGDGNTVVTLTPKSPGDSWQEYQTEVGLAPGTTYTIKFNHDTASAGDIKVDDIWLWHVPIARSTIASLVATKLSGLATDAGLTAVPSGSKTEGDYTQAIDAALRELNAVDPVLNRPDPRWIEDVTQVVERAEHWMLEQLYNEYSTKVDLAVGPRRESLSQIAKAIASRLDRAGSGKGKVVMRRLRHG